MERVTDPLLELLDRLHAWMIVRVRDVATGNADKRDTLAAVGTQMRALAAAEQDVLCAAAEKISLRIETRQFLDDYRNYRKAQLDALETLAHTRRSPRLFAQRAQELCELVARDAAQIAVQLIAVLRSKLPRAVYGALSRTFVARLGEHVAVG